MATLREIRRKLHSVGNIQKITQAMEMVAGSRLRRAQAKAQSARPYAIKLKEILETLVANAEDFVHPLFAKREIKKTGLIIIAGDRGLCGAYNNTVFSTAEKWLKQYSEDKVELFLFGRKTIDHFSRRKWPIGAKNADWGGKIAYPQIEEFAQNLLNQYLMGNLDEIWVVYTHFINVAARKVVIEKLLNIEPAQSDKKPQVKNYIFEPSVEEVLSSLLPRYCITKVQGALNEAYASELAARIFSMRAATKNAEEMKVKLTLIRNKIRQTGITRELIEITSCAESLNQ